MDQPKIFADQSWGQSWTEILVLYALTTVGVSLLFGTHTIIAMAIAPVVMVVMLLALLVFVQVLWMVMIGLERLGTAIGLRKSPLA